MSAPLVPRRAVAALFLERQHLLRPGARRLTAASLEAFVADTCGLQIDSVNVIDRAHHLTLWSRFGPYDRAAFDRLVYRRRVLFEYLAHVACFVPARDLALWRGIMDALVPRWKRRHGDPARTLPVAAVERAIAEAGVADHGAFERPGGRRSDGWWDWKPAQHAIDYLWKSGRIAVHSREHFRKRYALMERVLPQAAATAPMSPAEVARERVLRSLAAMGPATSADLAGYWTWPRMGTHGEHDALARLQREGVVREVRVEGSARPHFVRTADLPALERAARRRRPSRGTTLLCPFDSFLWHRDRVHRLWGYFYRIEIYVPAPKRTHGYYAMPLLHDGRLVGRVDLKHRRETGTLEARHVHFEPWFAAGGPAPDAFGPAPDPGAVFAGLAGALGSLARFGGAHRVVAGRVTPARWAGEVKRAIRTISPDTAR